MEYVRLGSSGLTVSRICLGMMSYGSPASRAWHIGEPEAEREMIPLCADEGVGVLPWSPLARGLLAGNGERGGTKRTIRAESDPVAEMYDDVDFDVVDAVREVAGGHGLSAAQIALARLLSKPDVTAPIVGATKLGHLEDAVAATAVRLTEDQVARLETAYRPHPVLGHG